MLSNYCAGEDSWLPRIARRRRSNQSILKEINPEYSLEGLMLKQKLQYFGHLMWRAATLEKMGKIEGEGGDRGWDGWMASPIQWTWVWANSEGQGSLECCSPWGHKESDMTEWSNGNNIMATVWSSVVKFFHLVRVSVSLKHLTGYGSEYYL